MRQLFNVLRTAAVMAAGEAVITREHLSDDFLDEARAAQAAGGVPGRPTEAQAPAPAPMWASDTGVANRSLEEMEIDAIRRAVDAAGGNISEASKRLGISRNTIYRKLRWNHKA